MNALVTAASEGGLLPALAALYTDLPRHPELSMHEVRTSKRAADDLAAHGYEVTRGVGETGVVGVLHNGLGPTVMVRADMDALPVTEETGLRYASTATAKDDAGVEVGVAHACGHDMHVTWLIGAARLLSEHRGRWSGTVLAVFEPGAGARGAGDDGRRKRVGRPKPAGRGGRGDDRSRFMRHCSLAGTAVLCWG